MRGFKGSEGLPAGHPDDLQAFVGGRLSQAEVALVLDHLSVCEQCLTRVDRLWAQHPAGLLGKSVPKLDPARAKELEERVVQRIQRSDLAGRVIGLGTLGFMNTSMAMFQPMLEAYLELLSLPWRGGKPAQPKGGKDV